MITDLIELPVLLALAKVTALLLMSFGVSFLIKGASLRATLWSVSLLLLPLIVAFSFSTPLLKILPVHDDSTPLTQPQIMTEPLFMETGISEETAPVIEEPLTSTEATTAAVESEKNIPWLPIIYFFGALFTLLPWLISLMKLRLLPKLPAAGSPRSYWRSLQCPGKLMFTPSPAAPFTCGIIKPSILLPYDSLTWSERRLQSTLLHEAAHLQRRDPLIRSLTSLVKAAFWFHPLVWLAHRQLITAQEQACDQHALRHGVNPEDYAEELLTSASYSHLTPSQALSMARWSQLGNRVRLVLSTQTQNPSSMKQITLLITTVSVISFAISSIGFAKEKPPQQASSISGLNLPDSLKNISLSGQALTTHNGKDSFETLVKEDFFLKLANLKISGTALLGKPLLYCSPQTTNIAYGDLKISSVAFILEDIEGSPTLHLRRFNKQSGMVSPWETFTGKIVFQTPNASVPRLEKVLSEAIEKLSPFYSTMEKDLLDELAKAKKSYGEKHPEYITVLDKVKQFPAINIKLQEDGSAIWLLTSYGRTSPKGVIPPEVRHLAKINPSQGVHFTSRKDSKNAHQIELIQKLTEIGITQVSFQKSTTTMTKKLGFAGSPEQMFRKKDINGDFQLSFEEFVNSDKPEDIEKLREAFDFLDKNTDLRLVLSELYRAYRAPK